MCNCIIDDTPTYSKLQVDDHVIKTPFKPHRLQSKELAPLIVPPVQRDLTLDDADVSDGNGGHGDSKTKLSTDSATSPTNKVNSGFERVAAVIVLQRHWRKLYNQRRADDERLGAMDDAEADRLDKNLARLHDRGGSKKAVGLGSLLRQRTGKNQDADSGSGRLRADLNSKRALPSIGSAASSPALDDSTADTQDADGGQTTEQRVHAAPPTLGDEALSSVLAPSVVYYWLKPKIPTALRPWSVPWAKYTPMSYVVAVFVFNCVVVQNSITYHHECCIHMLPRPRFRFVLPLQRHTSLTRTLFRNLICTSTHLLGTRTHRCWPCLRGLTPRHWFAPARLCSTS